METMKFLFTNSFYPPYHLGGDAVLIHNLGKALLKEGHEVHVLHSLDAFNLKSNKKIENYEKDEDDDGIFVHRLKSPFGRVECVLNYSFGSFPYTLNYFKNLVKKEKFDVVNHHNIALLGYKILKKVNSYKEFYTAHDYWLICQVAALTKNYNELCSKKECFSCMLKYRRPIQIFRYTKKFKEILNEIDTIIAPSKYMKDRLSEELLENKIEHIPNFVPEPAEKLNSFGDKNYFLFASAIEKYKGILNLVEVFKDDNIKSKLIIVGKGSLENYLKAYIKKNKLENKMIFLGWAEKDFLYSLYKNSLALILPSTWPENSPLSIIEALSVGTPTIGSDIGGIPEILEKVDESLIFKPNDIQELKEKILSFDKKKYSREKVEGAYKKFFSEKIYVEKYLRLLQ